MNRRVSPGRVAPPSDAAASFHAALPGYAPTPVRELETGLGLGGLWLKDESNRLGLPAFKVLGASWAVEQVVRERPDTHTLVAASAGNHGRAVARVAAQRGLGCLVFLPARSVRERRDAIASEGAQVVVVDGSYEDAVGAARAAAENGVVELADVGVEGPPSWVIDGYATLFAEAAGQVRFDLLVVPVGVGSLGAAAARFAASRAGVRVVGVEPDRAACLGASLAAGEPVEVATPGTTMAGLDCAALSPAAWPSLRDGIHGVVTVSDEEADAAVGELAGAGLAIGESGAAPLAGLRALLEDAACAELRDALEVGTGTRALLVATEGRTG